LTDSTPPRIPAHSSDVSSAADTTTQWLVRYRPWLTMLARLEIDSWLHGKFDASDIAQQTMMEAWKDAAQFRGQTERQRLAWLRQILAHVLAHEVRRYRGTEKRNIGREISIHQSLGQSSQRLSQLLVTDVGSPSHQASCREREVILSEVLDRLPDDYREVIILRNLEGLSHDEVARRMDRSAGAVRMLWVRALERLRGELAHLQ
jgi:RNA polymerase sigma-70 factor (ECF subfamily)